jgi:hypothetical protein
MSRAYYSCSLVGKVFAIVDEDGPVSITNDVEAVVAEVVRTYDIKSGQPMIYRDSEGRWDGIELDERGHFKDFILLGAYSIEDAIARLGHE